MDSTSTLVMREAEGNGKTEDTVKLIPDPASTNAGIETSKLGSRTGIEKGSAKDKSAKEKSTKAKSKKQKKTVVLKVEASSESDSDSSSSSSDSDSDDESTDTESSDSDAHTKKKSQRAKKKRHAAKAKKRTRNKKSKKPIKVQADSDSDSDSGSDSDSDSDSDSSTSSGFSRASVSDSSSGSSAPGNPRRTHHLPPPLGQLDHQVPQPQVFSAYPQYQQIGYYAPPMGIQMAPVALNTGMPSFGGVPSYQQPPPPQPRLSHARGLGRRPPPGRRPGGRLGLDNPISDNDQPAERKHSKSKRKFKSKTFKRVDQVWDSTIHNYRLQETTEGTTDAEYEGYAFHVRRTFDWEGKYKQTVVDIKSKVLRDALQEVMGDIKGVSLVEEVPQLDPNLLFLYLEDIRKHVKKLKTAEPKGDKKSRKKEAKRNVKKREQLKVLVKYLDKDYEAVKNSLNPLLENGLVTFDLLWALWKPNTLAFTTTYGSQDHPRIFKADMADKHFSMMKGEFYYIEGKYFEYDGKRFGYGNVADEIGEFRGTRKITSLPVYPLKYHKNEEQLRKELIERGKKFVALGGVQYKSYDGMAYYSKKKAAVKVNINGRIMIDPSIHRRINPNYPVSLVRPKDNDCQSDDEASDSEWGAARTGDGDGDQSGSDSDGHGSRLVSRKVRRAKTSMRMVRDRQGRVHFADDGPKKEVNGLEQVEVLGKENKIPNGDGEDDGDEKKTPEFSDEEYLIASPVVLGFAFSEKMWLEFTVSSVKEIQWNHNAYESLVLKPETKDIVKALVESHKYHAAESIDDVIQGKGKGLVAVLHGPPGTGKTLTAEGISELLKCPLYMVSAGELGTDSRLLESELQKILDICHAWGAILLLDEADVFLEKRNMRDIHRNALVSIFLRQLEYFQGILFLTTNRVETFDDAFQSRIHIALRYDSLDNRAKKAIFKIFIERVRVLEKIDLMPFSEEDYTTLARHDLNGRQIKNTVRTAQALAVNKGEPLSMAHIRQVLDVQMSFDRDLKGGPGFQDAMRSYF